MIARVLEFWWANACRVVYAVDEVGPACRFGFAYGTLPDHAECCEERFLVEWDRVTGAVHYDILAFFRSGHPLARLGYPLARDSAVAMRRAVGDGIDVPSSVTNTALPRRLVRDGRAVTGLREERDAWDSAGPTTAAPPAAAGRWRRRTRN